jgi:hypothetical protein
MVVWGGLGAGFFNNGGRYVLGASVDDDGYGYSECQGDCNDANSSAHPGATEMLCNAIDDDCDGVVDNGVSCNDANVCTTDTCDEMTGCAHLNNTLPCDDGNACTTSDTCSNGTCVSGAALNCDDGDICTADACDPATGCTTRTVNLDTRGFSANRIDGRDLEVLAAAWNSCPWDSRYNAGANLDQVASPPGACVDLTDFHLFMTAFGRRCP